MIDGVTPCGQGLAGSFGLAGAAGKAELAPSLTLNESDYLPMLAEFDLTENQARELLGALWQIMRACIELGIKFDVCGELGIAAVPVLSNDPASLDSNDHQS